MTSKTEHIRSITLELGKIGESNENSLKDFDKFKGFYITPTAYVDGRSDDVTNYILSAKNGQGKVEWTHNPYKTRVHAATTGNINLNNTTVVDNYTLEDGDRVLVKNQTNPEENGIYIHNGGILTRAPDALLNTDASNMSVPVINGDDNGLSLWISPEEDTVFGEQISFVTISGSASASPGLPINSVQYNDGGTFGGSDGILANNTSMTFDINSILNFGTGVNILSPVNSTLDVGLDILNINLKSDDNTTHFNINNNSLNNIMQVFGDRRVTINSAINSTSSTTGSLIVNGGVGITGDTYIDGIAHANSYITLSDQRYKTNINRIARPLDVIYKLHGYTYNYTTNNQKSAGIMAQELEKTSLYFLVHEDKQGIKRVDYQALSGLLIESIKNLDQDFREFKREIRRSMDIR